MIYNSAKSYNNEFYHVDAICNPLSGVNFNLSDSIDALGYTCPYLNAAVFEIEDVDILLQKLQHIGMKAFENQALSTEMLELDSAFLAGQRIEAAGVDAALFAKGALRLFNPSLAKLPAGWNRSSEERWLAAFRFRTQNGFPEDANYPTPLEQGKLSFQHESHTWAGPLWASNHIVLAVLNNSMFPTRPVVVLGPQDLSTEPFECQARDSGNGRFGPEDARLHVSEGSDEVFLAWTGREQTSYMNIPCAESVNRKYMSKIGPDLKIQSPTPLQVDADLGLDLQGDTDLAPFTHQSHTLVEYSISPHVVAKLSFSNGVPTLTQTWNTSFDKHLEKLMQESDGNTKWKRTMVYDVTRKPRGGVSPILYNHGGKDVYLSILHTLVPSVRCDGSRASNHYACYAQSDDCEPLEYRSHLYTFETSPPFEIIGVGKRTLPLPTKRLTTGTKVAKPAQLLDPSMTGKGKWWVLFGQGDCQSQRLELSATQLEDYLP
jgi:hypothetical protein